MRSFVILSSLLVAGAANAQTLDMTGCPGPVDVSVTGLTPGATAVFLMGAAGLGSDVVSRGVCTGTETGLAGLRFATRVTDHDGDGALSFTPTVGDDRCDVPVQVLDTTSCTVSNVDTPAGADGEEGWYFGDYEGIPTIPDPGVYYGSSNSFACADVCAFYGLSAVGARWVCNHYDGGSSEGCGPDNHFEWTDAHCSEQIIDGVYVPGGNPACGGEGQLRNYVDGIGSEGYTWHALECQCR